MLGWLHVSFRQNRRLVIVFLLYVTTIVCFAAIYYSLYRASVRVGSSTFAFNADILRSRNDQNRISMAEQLNPLKKQIAVLSDLQRKLADLPSLPKPQPLVGTSLDYVEIQVNEYTCEFDLYPFWRWTNEGRVVKRDGLIIEDSVGRKLLSRDVEIVGPKDAKPRPKEVQEWVDAVASGLDITLYRQLTTNLLGGLAAEVARVNTDFEAPEHFWSYWDFVYFSTMTQTTVGYGDILPNSTVVRMVVVAQVMIGLIFIGFALNFVFRIASNSKETRAP